MSTKTLTIPCPHVPVPNPAAFQLLLMDANGEWRFTALNGNSTWRQIKATSKFVKVGLSAQHFAELCLAFLEPGPTKGITVHYSGTVVSKVEWSLGGGTVSVSLPDLSPVLPADL